MAGGVRTAQAASLQNLLHRKPKGKEGQFRHIMESLSLWSTAQEGTAQLLRGTEPGQGTSLSKFHFHRKKWGNSPTSAVEILVGSK